jgi:6-pyruvoyltetrahydropterin/6-carboxytetrahydropterin synthase
VRERVISRLDRKYLNRDVADLRERPVTPENLTQLIARWLAPYLPPEVRLTSITLEPEPLRRVELQLPFEESPRMQVTHVYEFSASHRLHSQVLTEEQNIDLFGKCNNANGHGHNYVLEVTVQGPIDARTGRVVDPDALDAAVNREVVDRYDHRHLNEDIPEFSDLIPSAEWITRVIWDRLKDHIPSPARLARVHLKETARNLFEYRGEDDPL